MTKDLFHNHRRNDGGEEFVETRVSRKQYMEDNAWRPLVVQYIYERGSRGVTLEILLNHGVEREWWQDTAAKHFGEKMRVAFGTGLIYIPIFPTVTKLKHIIVLHPAFADIKLHNPVLQDDIDRAKTELMKQDYVRQK